MALELSKWEIPGQLQVAFYGFLTCFNFWSPVLSDKPGDRVLVLVCA